VRQKGTYANGLNLAVEESANEAGDDRLGLTVTGRLARALLVRLGGLWMISGG
jgi:hypothetical protein